MPSDAIAQELSGNRALVHQVIERYRSQFPGIWENYTLVLLLVIRDQGVWISPEAIAKAAAGDLPNLTSIHRALTLVKKDYQTPEQARRSDELEEDWRETLSGEP
jgi:hypothetical protein